MLSMNILYRPILCVSAAGVPLHFGDFLYGHLIMDTLE